MVAQASIVDEEKLGGEDKLSFVSIWAAAQQMGVTRNHEFVQFGPEVNPIVKVEGEGSSMANIGMGLSTSKSGARTISRYVVAHR
ncbi:hypothetical protein V6N12_072481 [Hibiscus sabdariffa]|uniref:Uncharacterized protein n=1 Tax=Hibiscus sabdariffa TaxID=183260 RepID=A0ABR2FNB5_9ROSI